MVQLQNQRNRLAWPSLIGRCVVACTMVLLTQIALSLVPRFLPASPLLIQLSLSVVSMLVVVGLGWLYRRLLGIHASAPAFVFFTVLFIWCFYLLIIRKGVSLVMDFVFNGEAVLLITGQKNYLLFMVLLVGFLVTEASYLACLSKHAVKSEISSILSSEVAFFTWHVYCMCFNIKTDEWVNWKKYPEFHLTDQH